MTPVTLAFYNGVAVGPHALTGLGVATWLLVGVPAMTRAFADGWVPPASGPLWWASYLAFGAAFLGAVATPLKRLSVEIRRALLVVQTVTALVLVEQGPSDVTVVLLVVVAAQAGNAVHLWAGVAWVVIQTVALALIVGASAGRGAVWPPVLAFGVFQGFAFVTARLTRIEAEGRQELARVNAELVAAQTLLGRTTRLLERQRISHELHDAMGHHLTALSLHLEALRVATGVPVPALLDRAQHLTRELLADLRETVRDLRQDDPLPLRQALEALARGVAGIDVHLAYRGDDLAHEPDTARALFRCTQELMTNVLKHAHAREVWLTVDADAHGVRVDVRDDGVGADPETLARGLMGIRQRIASHDGQVVVDTAPGRGCAVAIHLPRGTPT